MSEYRYNLLTDQWVILATERGDRPHGFDKPQEHRLLEFDDNCPFCPGHEHLTPPEVFSLPYDHPTADQPDWSVRVIPNKYPAVSPHANPPSSPAGRSSLPGDGIHEVIIESPRHNCHFARHNFDHARCVLRTLRDRYRFHLDHSHTHLICIFCNHGNSSGASLAHPHWQLIAPTLIPSRLAAQLQYCRDYQTRHKQSVFDTLIEQELSAHMRVITCTNHFVALCPPASMAPYEVYVLPRADQAHLSLMDDDMLADLTQILRQLLARLDEGFNDPDYNLAFRTAPTTGCEYPGFRWYLQLCPRLATPGSFELATDIYINTVAPESAAGLYRE